MTKCAMYLLVNDQPCYFLAVIRLQGVHICGARALLRWSQRELSKKAKIALGSIRRMEAEDGPVHAQTETLYRLLAVFQAAGIEFLDDEKPGVRLHKTLTLARKRTPA